VSRTIVVAAEAGLTRLEVTRDLVTRGWTTILLTTGSLISSLTVIVAAAYGLSEEVHGAKARCKMASKFIDHVPVPLNPDIAVLRTVDKFNAVLNILKNRIFGRSLPVVRHRYSLPS